MRMIHDRIRQLLHGVSSTRTCRTAWNFTRQVVSTAAGDERTVLIALQIIVYTFDRHRAGVKAIESALDPCCRRHRHRQ